MQTLVRCIIRTYLVQSSKRQQFWSGDPGSPVACHIVVRVRITTTLCLSQNIRIVYVSTLTPNCSYISEQNWRFFFVIWRPNETENSNFITDREAGRQAGTTWLELCSYEREPVSYNMLALSLLYSNQNFQTAAISNPVAYCDSCFFNSQDATCLSLSLDCTPLGSGTVLIVVRSHTEQAKPVETEHSSTSLEKKTHVYWIVYCFLARDATSA